MEYLSYDSLYFQLYNVQLYWKEYGKYFTSISQYEIHCRDRFIYYDKDYNLHTVIIFEEGVEYIFLISSSRTSLYSIYYNSIRMLKLLVIYLDLNEIRY